MTWRQSEAYGVKLAKDHRQAVDREDEKRLKDHKIERNNADALDRLERWLLARERGEYHWVRYIHPPVRKGAYWNVGITVGPLGFTGRRKTLAEAIHAALDEAEAK